jgi:hypothetical protein
MSLNPRKALRRFKLYVIAVVAISTLYLYSLPRPVRQEQQLKEEFLQQDQQKNFTQFLQQQQQFKIEKTQSQIMQSSNVTVGLRDEEKLEFVRRVLWINI